MVTLRLERAESAVKERAKRLLEGWKAAQQQLHFATWTLAASDSPSTALFRVGEVRFVLRHSDWNGFREIFIKDEYGIVPELLGNLTEPVILDLGANVGLFSVYVFSQFPLASVVSVEPSSITFDILVRNREMNPALQWQCRRGALHDRDGTVQFQNAATSTASRIDAGGDEEVPAVTLSSLLATSALQSVDLVKLDVEGAEGRALQGGTDVIDRVRNLLVEVHPEVDFDTFHATLTTAFPHVYRIRRDGSSKPLLLATREPRRSRFLEPSR